MSVYIAEIRKQLSPLYRSTHTRGWEVLRVEGDSATPVCFATDSHYAQKIATALNLGMVLEERGLEVRSRT